ncbi:MAG: PTS sugar transporter subunit IIA [Pseudomonadota bacterium]
MGVQDILSREAVIPNVAARCKREVISIVAKRACELTGIADETISAALMDREQLGSTGLGDGVAIPHGKIAGLNKITGVFAKLSTPIDFDAVDGMPVDLVFLLLAPSEASAAHLKALAKVSRLLREADIREALRGAETTEAIYAIASNPEHSNAA